MLKIEWASESTSWMLSSTISNIRVAASSKNSSGSDIAKRLSISSQTFSYILSQISRSSPDYREWKLAQYEELRRHVLKRRFNWSKTELQKEEE